MITRLSRGLVPLTMAAGVATSIAGTAAATEPPSSLSTQAATMHPIPTARPPASLPTRLLTAGWHGGPDIPFPGALALDARPSEDGIATALLVAESGVWELTLAPPTHPDYEAVAMRNRLIEDPTSLEDSGRRPARCWRAGFELPAGFYGPAAYLADGTPVVVRQTAVGGAEGARRYSLLTLADSGFAPWPADLANRPILDLLATRDGGLWIAYQPGPSGTDGGASLERINGDRVSRRVDLPSANLASVADWAEGPAGSLWLATGLGLIEVLPVGGSGPRLGEPEVIRRSKSRVSRLTIDGSNLAVAGSGLGRFDDDHLVRIAPRWHVGSDGVPPILGPVFDLAVTSSHHWLALYGGGRLAIVDPNGGDVVLLGPEDGVPEGATRLLYEPVTDTIIFGGRGIGIAARRLG